MIRNVVLCRLRPGVPLAALEPGLRALAGLRVDGLPDLVVHAGPDLGLREGAADAVVTCDLPDEDAYRTYDADVEHNRIRAELIAPHCEQVLRAQLHLPG